MKGYLVSRNYSAKSLKQRRSILGRFADAFDPICGDADAFLSWWATTEHLSPASRRSTLQAVDGWLSWLVQKGARADNPAKLVRKPTVPKRPPLVLNAAEVRRLRNVVAGTRLELPVALMLDNGLRLSEVVAIGHDDLVDGDWLRVLGKGGKLAIIPASQRVVRLWPDTGDPWQLSTSSLHKSVKAAMADAGIGRQHGPHSLRRTAGTEMAARGVPLAVVAAVLRHEGLGSLHHYVAVGRDDMRAAVA
ncbi:MAG: hypothetical protein EBR82_18075 [Caulobacteraceae bacterium]|nr:hypothetical protein [Caulobacteraceae bacterium]